MSQPTTMHIQHQTLVLRLPGAGHSANAGRLILRVALAGVIAQSLLAAVATAGQRETGVPAPLAPPAVIVRDSAPVMPPVAPEPMPGPHPVSG